jgi:hypothetical protein
MEIQDAIQQIENSKGNLFLAELGNGKISFYLAKSLESLKTRLHDKYKGLTHGQAWLYNIDSMGERRYIEPLFFNCEDGCTVTRMGEITHRGHHYSMGDDANWKRAPKHTDNEYRLALAQWLLWFETEYEPDYQRDTRRYD